MRWYILRTLLEKELRRHAANRGGIALAALLVVAALLLSLFGRADDQTGNLLGTVQSCFIDYWEDGPWIAHLRDHVPDGLRPHVQFRFFGSDFSARAHSKDETIMYPPGTGAIQVRSQPAQGPQPHYLVWFWYPGQDRGSLAPFEAWFWKETNAYYLARADSVLKRAGNPEAAQIIPSIREEYTRLQGGFDPRSGLATALVLFALFFICVYLLPSLTCEERERGVLLAQALSPASPEEILTAKFIFYPLVGMALAGFLAGLQNPRVLALPFFWLTLGVLAVGCLGIGLTIATLAKNQRAASMGALCYMLAVALLLIICGQNNITFLPYFALEYHGPRMLHAALTGSVQWYHWGNLAVAAGLAGAWVYLASTLFRRYGWQ